MSLLYIGLSLILLSCATPKKELTIATNRNKLAESLSPYLLQHADNPVNWYPWGDEAFTKSREENKPIFLSIGYAACHWCHVMAHESFEDDSIATFLNDHFISIKVDREEHPDVDEIYMTAVQMMTGSGGWPLSVFLTSDLKPFYGGTYFPPEDRWGRPGFKNILFQIATAYRDSQDKILESADKLTEQIQSTNVARTASEIDRSVIDLAVESIVKHADMIYGGFGPAPKFPPTGQIDLLLRAYDRSSDSRYLKLVELTLTEMRHGGIYDQVGGGFHRYSTDEKWLVPHFEKMLYDNALLSLSLIDCYLASGNEFFANSARHTLDWVLRDMVSDEGGCYSTLDADSDGEEGKFYVWTLDEIKELLGENADLFIDTYGITKSGNFEHQTNILHIDAELTDIASKYKLTLDEVNDRLAVGNNILLDARNKRIHPALDDKILTDWNGLMMSAFARGYRAFGDEKYLVAAQKISEFIRMNMWNNGTLQHSYRNRTLQHSYRNGTSGIDAMLDDHAFLLSGLVDLYQAGFDPIVLREATLLGKEMIKLFWDDQHGGFYHVPEGRTDLISRSKHARDGAIPSGNGIAAGALLELYQLTDDDDFRDSCNRTIQAFQSAINQMPTAHLRMISVIDQLTSPLKQIAIIGEQNDQSDELLKVINSTYLPGTVIAFGSGDNPIESALLLGRSLLNDLPTAYYCVDMTCKAPINSPDELRQMIKNN